MKKYQLKKNFFKKVNSSKLEEMKTAKDKLDYIRGRIISGLQDFAEK